MRRLADRATLALCILTTLCAAAYAPRMVTKTLAELERLQRLHSPVALMEDSK